MAHEYNPNVLTCGSCGDVNTSETSNLYCNWCEKHYAEVCLMCGDEKYADDAFCNGTYCVNDRYRASYGIQHEHSPASLAQNEVCEGCITLTNAEARL